MELDAVLLDAETMINDLQAQVQVIQQRLDALVRERDGLALALGRHHEPRRGPLHPAPVRPGAGPVDLEPDAIERGIPPVLRQPIRVAKRVVAVEDCLREAGQAMTLLEIIDRLSAKGRPNETTARVSTTLSYLQRTSRAKQLRRGLWIHPDVLPAQPARVETANGLDPGRL